MSRGIVIVAFGQEYDRFAAKCSAITRRNTSLPIHVITNLDRLSGDWASLPDITFQPIKYAENVRNREFKTGLIDYTPFDETIYLDCDALVARSGVESIFEGMSDVVFNPIFSIAPGSRYANIYARAISKFGVPLPVTVYSGAFFAFSKSGGSRRLFELWSLYWRQFGRQRDMPCLACAVKTSEVVVSPSPPGFIAVECLSDSAVIQHRCAGFSDKFGFTPDLTRDESIDQNPYFKTDWSFSVF
jgi:hypothetical protein